MCKAPSPLERARRGVALVVSSPSGAGKTTLTRHLVQSDPNLELSISVTTRPPRPREKHAEHDKPSSQRFDFFPSVRSRRTTFPGTGASRPQRNTPSGRPSDDAEFDRMVEASELLEHASVFGHQYGSPREFVESRTGLAAGRDVAFDIDWQGARQLRQAIRDDMVSVYVLPPGRNEQRERLTRRGQDSGADVSRRLAEAARDIEHWQEYRYIILNDDLERSKRALAAILEAARLEGHYFFRQRPHGSGGSWKLSEPRTAVGCA